MRIVKPLRLSLLHRCFENVGKPVLSVTAMLTFRLDAPKSLQQEVVLWKAVTKSTPNGVVDEFMPKTRGELLVFGSAYTGAEPKPMQVVRFAVTRGEGKEQKVLAGRELLVFGDRAWGLSAATEPRPFTEMPLVAERAFGGEGFEDNPVGRGLGMMTINGIEAHLLPNIELRSEPVTSRRDRPRPALLGPLDVMSKERVKRRGTYDRTWLETRFPYYPEDFDWEFFNVAPPEQRIDGFFDGAESLSISGMNPDHPTLTTTFPPAVVRAFIERKKRPDHAEEVPLRIDTVIAFPSMMLGVLLFRGTTPVEEDDAHDIRTLIAGVDGVDELREPSHFMRISKIREDLTEFHAELLEDSTLLPSWFVEPDMLEEGWNDMAEHVQIEHLRRKRGQAVVDKQTAEAREHIEVEVEKAMRVDHLPEKDQAKAREKLDEADLREKMLASVPKIDLMGGPGVPTKLGEIPQAMARAREELKKTETDLKEREARAEQEMRERFAEIRAARKENGQEEIELDYDKLKKQALIDAAGPPKHSAVRQFDKLREELEKLANEHKVDVSAQRAELNKLDRARLVELDELALKGYRSFGHTSLEPPAMLSPEDSASRVQFALSRLAQGESLEGFDFTGVDLSGVDLSGAKLGKALFECARFAGAVLAGCDLRGAMLGRASLDGGDFSRADLREANLSRSTFAGARFDGARFEKSQWFESNLGGGSFRGASINMSTFVKTTFGEVDFAGAKLTMTTLIEGDLSGSSFEEIEADQLTFIKAKFDRVSFKGAKLTRTTFIQSTGDEMNFDEIKVDRMATLDDTAFPGATFRRAYMRQACLRATNLAGADFTEADAETCDFSGADLSNAKLYKMRAPSSLFIRTNLKWTDMKSTWLINSVLQKALVHGADFRGSNLFRADLSKMKGDSKTNFTDAYLMQITRAGSLSEENAKLIDSTPEETP